MNQTAPIGQKQLGKLVESRMHSTAPKTGALSINSKAVGLSDEMLNVIGEHEDMYYLIKLHQFIQKVRSSNGENADCIGKIKESFKELNEKISTVQKEQSKTPGTAADKKKDDPKKTK